MWFETSGRRPTIRLLTISGLKPTTRGVPFVGATPRARRACLSSGGGSSPTERDAPRVPCMVSVPQKPCGGLLIGTHFALTQHQSTP